MWDYVSIFWWLILTLFSLIIGLGLGYFGRQIKERFKLKNGKPQPRFEIYKDKNGKFRFRLKAANGEIIAISEAYETKQGCQNGVKSVKENTGKAIVKDST